MLISGRAQGVFFRSSTAREAKLRGLTGWVMNLQDGRVEAIVEGEMEMVVQVIAFCKKGPEGAQVENVDIVWEPFTASYSGFETR